MNTFKKVMAVPMLLALLWLAWVLTKQVDYRGLLIVLLGLAALAAFCWLLGRRQFGRSSSTIVMAALGTLTAASLALTACGIFDRGGVEYVECRSRTECFLSRPPCFHRLYCCLVHYLSSQ